MDDLRSLPGNRVQLTTDGDKANLQAEKGALGGDVNHAQLLKLYGEPTGHMGHERMYSPSECTGTKTRAVKGRPDMAWVGTSHVERRNPTMRMHMHGFTRLTNGFSKKVENHAHAVALHFMYRNFCRQHQTARLARNGC